MRQPRANNSSAAAEMGENTGYTTTGVGRRTYTFPIGHDEQMLSLDIMETLVFTTGRTGMARSSLLSWREGCRRPQIAMRRVVTRAGTGRPVIKKSVL